MANINLTPGDDVYVQAEADKGRNDTVEAGNGADTVRLYQGTVAGGAGDDRIELIVDPANPGRRVNAAYWSAPSGAVINLQEGWALDGQGGRDTLVGVNGANGSSHDDRLIGNAADNSFATNHGHDFMDGAGGFDTAHLWFRPRGQSSQRVARQDELDIRVSADGRHAFIQAKGQTDYSVTLIDVEQVEVSLPDGTRQFLRLADFITPEVIAQDTIAAGPTLRWNAALPLGSATTLTYSFVATAPASGVGSPGFRPFSTAEQQLVRDILARTSQWVGLDFVETREATAEGQLRFGVSQQAATKGVSWLPQQPDAGDLAGDVWMDTDSMLGLAPGTEGYQALLHEIGHALGLRHPRNVDAGDAWAVQMRAQDDRAGLSVMSSLASGDGLFHRDWAPLDLLALRYLYGARTSHSADDVHRLTAAHATASSLIVDDGGSDTLDASAWATPVRLDLRPGGLSSVGVTPDGRLAVDNVGLGYGTQIEHAIGTAADDLLFGNAADNMLTGGLGNDRIDGGDGRDTVVLAGPRAGYTVGLLSGNWFVSADDEQRGHDTLLNIERLRFGDLGVALDLSGNAGAVAQIVRALFGAATLDNPTVVGIGLSLLDGGMAYADAVALAISTPLFEQAAGGRSNTAFVNHVYRNLFGVAPGAADLAIYVDLLDSGSATQASLALLACQLPLNTQSVDLLGLSSTGLDFMPTAG